MKILSLSDKVVEFIYSSSVKNKFTDVDLVLGCGDLPYYYLEFVVDALNVPVYFVRGNHASKIEFSENGERTGPEGACDLHRKTINHKGLLLAGFEGSLRYKPGGFQYSQTEMWWMVLLMIPKLLRNRLLYGRYLDIFVSHSPSWEVNDQDDRAHQGFKAFRWLVKTFKPSYHFHGHVHNYDGRKRVETKFHNTLVINAFGYQKTLVKLRDTKHQGKGKDEQF